MKVLLIIAGLAFLFPLASCGVKGAPLTPVSAGE